MKWFVLGISVGFYDYSDENNPVLLGSDDTDSAGKASFTYYSTGAGDVPVKAKVGSLLTKTYSIEDIYKYGTSVSSWSVIDSSSRKSDFVLPTDHEIIFKFNNTPNSQIAVINSANNYWQYACTVGYSNFKNVAYRTDATHWNTDNLSFDLNKDYEYRIALKDGFWKLYVNDVLIATKTVYTGNTETKYIRLIGIDRVEWFKVKEL